MSQRNYKSRRSILGLLVAGWLSLGLQPCLVAAAEHACPHCPPESAESMPAHHEGHGHHAAAEEAAPTCASMQADCCDAASATVANRGAADEAEKPDSSTLVSPPVPAVADKPRVMAVPLRPPDPRARSAPLNVLYCVYLK
jgi:hypothetical protein